MSSKVDKPAAILWFRRDLRLTDNPALAAAMAHGGAIVPLFIDDSESGTRNPGGASKWWRGASLSRLDESLRALGSRLIVRQGRADQVLRAVLTETGASALFYNLRRDPVGVAEDTEIAARMRALSVRVETGDANYLHDPHHLRTGAGGGFKVFTPFWNRLREIYRPPNALPAPKRLTAPERWPGSVSIAHLSVTDAWTKPIAQAWQPGEAAALTRLTDFADEAVAEYSTARDRPDVDGTSRLSPHLAWGEISVHAIWRHLTRTAGDAAMAFLREIAWRDFNMHLLHGFPELSWQPIQEKFAAFPAKNDDARANAWQRGLTGYPIVDAGMRQLWQTGWMHNRVRMIVGSFLVKDLLLPWQRGEEWFWDTLVDADLAQNGGNWQWIAGCGADAAPFFRVFNPTLQAEKFDPKGCYVREWVPELAKLSDSVIHEPWKATPAQLSEAGIKLDRTYPLPIVDHAKARQIALAAYKRISGEGTADDAPTLL